MILIYHIIWSFRTYNTTKNRIVAIKMSKCVAINTKLMTHKSIISFVFFFKPQKPIKLIITTGIHWIGKCLVCFAFLMQLQFQWMNIKFCWCIYFLFIVFVLVSREFWNEFRFCFSDDDDYIRIMGKGDTYTLAYWNTVTKQTNWKMKHPFYGFVCKFFFYKLFNVKSFILWASLFLLNFI